MADDGDNVIIPRIGNRTIAQMFEAAISDPDVQDRLLTLRQHVERTVPEINELQDVDLPAAALSGLRLTHINGNATLPEQNVIIKYLKNDQRLLIPSALGMSLDALQPGRCVGGEPLLRTRYFRLQSATYQQMSELITTNQTTLQIRAYVDGLPMPRELIRKTDWITPAWYAIDGNRLDDPIRAASVFACISHALQFNCDIRDFGFLMTERGTTSDASWIEAAGVDRKRVKLALQAYTHLSVAALNFVAVGNYGLTAWARAYGLSMGLLRDARSQSIPEYSFTSRHAPTASTVAVSNYKKSSDKNMLTCCLNLIAMFGLLHLNKDDTYKKGDAAMERIGTSFINTLRTGIDQTLIEEMNCHRESVLRTAAHPFGLAQTYWLAQVMGRHNLLMAPLAIRVNLCPPPVQRLMYVDATASGWNNLPIGRRISDMYAPELATIRAEIRRVRMLPPSFSGLFHLYGVDQQETVSFAAGDAVKTLIPAVCGYVNVTHVSDRNERDGLALEQGFRNMERDAKVLVMVWKNAWDKYLNKRDKQGLSEFVDHMAIGR